MKLYIKQRIFSFKDKYDIYDENENLVYYVDSQLFSMVAKLRLLDAQERELFFIRGKFRFLLSEYDIEANGELCATIHQKMSFLKSKLYVESKYGQFDIQGNFMGMDYDIYYNGHYFGGIHKKWLSWGDSYELDIPSPENAAFFCALVVAIDNCLHNSSNNN